MHLKKINNFFTDEESSYLIKLYEDNKSLEQYIKDDIYNFKVILLTFNNIKIKNSIIKKLILCDIIDSEADIDDIRINLIDKTVELTDTYHSHGNNTMDFVGYLNDNFEGGKLEFKFEKVKPIKNMLVHFPGKLPHRVGKLVSGKRYSIVGHIIKENKSDKKTF